MSFIKKYWWIIAAALIYWKWDEVSKMLGLNKAEKLPEVPKPLVTVPTEQESKDAWDKNGDGLPDLLQL